MARLFTSGIETGDFTGTEWTLAGAGWAVSTASVHSGTYAAKSGSADATSLYRTLAANLTSGSVWFRAYLKFTGAVINSTNILFVSQVSGASNVLTIDTVSSHFKLTNNVAATSITGSYTILADTWYRLEFCIDPITSGTGHMELRIYLGDATSPVETIAPTDGATLATGVGMLRMSSRGTASNPYYLDDFAWNDSSGSVQNSWCGPGKTALMKPNSDVSVAWTKAGSTPAGTNYGGVDDEPGVPNDGIDFNQDANTTNVDRLGLTALPAEVPSNAEMILADVYGRVGSDATTARTMIFRVWDENGTSADGPSISVAVNGWKIVSSTEHQIVSLSGKSKSNVETFNVGYKGNSGSNRNKNITAQWVNVEWREVTSRKSFASWSEFEIPTAPRRAFCSWAEFEVPLAPRKTYVSWGEFEVPAPYRRGLVSWAEVEVPDITARRARVAWAEFELPPGPRRSFVSWSELEVPLQSRIARVSWSELETPLGPRKALVSWSEFEVPISSRLCLVTWAEFMCPDLPGANQQYWLTVADELLVDRR